MLNVIYEHEFDIFINHNDAMQNRNGFRSWLADVKDLLYKLGFAYLWDTQNITSLQIKAVDERLYDQYIQIWYSCVNASPNLRTYRFLRESLSSKATYSVYKIIITELLYLDFLLKMLCT